MWKIKIRIKTKISHFCDNFFCISPHPPPSAKRKKRKIYTRKIKISPFFLGWKSNKFHWKKSLVSSYQILIFFFEVQVKFQLGLVPAFDFLSKCVVLCLNRLVRTRLFLFSPSLTLVRTNVGCYFFFFIFFFFFLNHTGNNRRLWVRVDHQITSW